MKPALAVIVIIVVSGCLSATAPVRPARVGSPADGVAWAERALGVDGNGKHDHYDSAAHLNASTPNFHILGYDPLLSSTFHNSSAGGYLCGEAWQTPDGRKLAVVNSFGTNVAFVLVDVTDTAHPKKLGEFTLVGGHPYDVALTPDGDHVLVGDDPSPVGLPVIGLASAAPTSLRYHDECTGRDMAVPGPVAGVYGPATLLVGIHDPSKPVLEDFVPAPVLGPHSVSTALIDGRTLVMSSTTNLEHQLSYYQLFEVKGGKLELLGMYQAPTNVGPTAAIVNGHVDANIMKHPVTGKTLAYLADWDAGVVILDITNPAAPTQVSQWSPHDDLAPPGVTVAGISAGGDESGEIHEAVPIPGLWDGRHYVLAGQEIGGHPRDHPTGYVYILDDTDPAKLSLVGKWTLPVDVSWTKGGQFSTHYVSLVNRTMFVTAYHAGVWAVDLSSAEKLKDPPSIGAFLPAFTSPSPSKSRTIAGTPTVMDAPTYPDGTIVVFDQGSGVYALRFDDAHPMPAPPTWEQSKAK